MFGRAEPRFFPPDNADTILLKTCTAWSGPCGFLGTVFGSKFIFTTWGRSQTGEVEKLRGQNAPLKCTHTYQKGHDAKSIDLLVSESKRLTKCSSPTYLSFLPPNHRPPFPSQPKMEDDDDPQALLVTFDKCRRRADGTVDTHALVHWLRLEVDAPAFVHTLEGLGKASYTRAEFERLVLHGAGAGEGSSSNGTLPESGGGGGPTTHTSTSRSKQERKQRPPSPRRERLVEEEVGSPRADELPPSNDTHGPRQTRRMTTTTTKATTKHHHHHRHHHGEDDVDEKCSKEGRTTTSPSRPPSASISVPRREPNLASRERASSTSFASLQDRTRQQRVIERGVSARPVKQQQQQRGRSSTKWRAEEEQDQYASHSCSSQSEGSSSSGSSSEDEEGANGMYRHHRHHYHHQHQRKPSSSTSPRRDALPQHRSPSPSLGSHQLLSPQLTQGIRDFFRLGIDNTANGASSSSHSRLSPPSTSSSPYRTYHQHQPRGHRRGAAEERDKEAAEEGRQRATVISREGHGSWTEALAQSTLHLHREEDGIEERVGGRSSSRKVHHRNHSRSRRYHDRLSASPPPRPSTTSKYSRLKQQQKQQPPVRTHQRFFGFPWTTTSRTPSRPTPSRTPSPSRRQRRTNDREEGCRDDGVQQRPSFQPSTTSTTITLRNPAADSGSLAAFDQSLPWGGMLAPRDSEAASLITGHTYWRKDDGKEGGRASPSRTVDPALRAVMDGLDQLSGTARPHLKGLLQTAQDHAVSALANDSRPQNRVLLEGNVELWSPFRTLGGLFMSWVPFHLVLYAGTKEIRLYQCSIPSAWGIIPLHEKGALELRLLEKIECPTDAQWGGRRFDLIVRASSGAALDAKYPGLGVFPGDEDRATHTARYNFRAPSAQNRLLWVSLITAVLDSCSVPSSSSSASSGERMPIDRTLPPAPLHTAPVPLLLPSPPPPAAAAFLPPPVSSAAAAISTTSSAALAPDGAGLGGGGETLRMTSRAPLRASYSSFSPTTSCGFLNSTAKTGATHRMSTTSSSSSPLRGGAGHAPVVGR